MDRAGSNITNKIPNGLTTFKANLANTKGDVKKTLMEAGVK